MQRHSPKFNALGNVDLNYDAISRLTPLEQKILPYLVAGLSDREIGEALYLKAKTVGWYSDNIKSKLNVTSKTQLASYCIMAGRVDVEAVQKIWEAYAPHLAGE